jgi:thioredoxin 1
MTRERPERRINPRAHVEERQFPIRSAFQLQHSRLLYHLYFGGQEARSVSDNIVYLTDESFQTEVLDSTEPVLVDYWAEWCGPCKMIAPILTEIADEYQGKVKIAKLNIDENPQTPPRYGIRGIPTLMLFKNGNVEATKVGALSKSQLTAFIDTNL